MKMSKNANQNNDLKGMNTSDKFSRIYLLGYMGSGKSTLGKRLANLMNYNFMDTDQVFEQYFQTSINDFFQHSGEKLFRQYEQQILHDTFYLQDTIISLGGGTPCYFDNMEKIRKNGLSIYLRMPPKAIQKRLLETKRQRPLTSGLNENELLQQIEQNLPKREYYYEQADLCVSGLNLKPTDIVKIISYYQNQ
ncbi:MAG: shikimate kinase [Bacteroidota bacterium]